MGARDTLSAGLAFIVVVIVKRRDEFIQCILKRVIIVFIVEVRCCRGIGGT